LYFVESAFVLVCFDISCTIGDGYVLWLDLEIRFHGNFNSKRFIPGE